MNIQKTIIILLITIIILWILLKNSVREHFHIVTPADTNKTYSAGSKTNPDKELIISRDGNSRIREGPMSLYGYDINIVGREIPQTQRTMAYNQLPDDNPKNFLTDDAALRDTSLVDVNQMIAQQNMFLLDSYEAAGKVEPIHPEIYGVSMDANIYDPRYRPFNDIQTTLTLAQVDNPIVNELTYDNAYFDLWQTDVLREIQRDKEMAKLFEGKNAVPFDHVNECMSKCTNRNDCIGFTVNKYFLDPEYTGVKVCNLTIEPPYKTDRDSYDKIQSNANYRAHRVRNVTDISNPNNVYFKKVVRDKTLDRYEAPIKTDVCKSLCPKCAIGKCPNGYRCNELATDPYGTKCFVTNELNYDETANLIFDSDMIKPIPDSFGHNMAAGDDRPIKPVVQKPFVQTATSMTLPVKVDTPISSATDQNISTRTRAKKVIVPGAPLALSNNKQPASKKNASITPIVDEQIRLGHELTVENFDPIESGASLNCDYETCRKGKPGSWQVQSFAEPGLSNVTINSDKKFAEYQRLSNGIAGNLYC